MFNQIYIKLMRKFMMMVIVAAAATTAFAQNEVKEAKKLLDKGQIDEALKVVEPLKNAASAEDKAAAWNMVSEIYWKKFSDIQTTQLENQVKKIDAPYDTIGMHHAAVAALEAALKCDEFDIQPNEKGKVKPRFRAASQTKFQQGRLNAINAGQYDFNLKDYQQAFKDFSLYVDSHNAPLFEGIDLKDQYYHEIAYFASLAAYNAKDWPNVVKYAKIASENPEKAKDATEILVFAKKETIKTHADTLEYIEMLKDANNKFPDDQRYSAWIGDYYLQSASNDELLKWAEEEIQKDPNNKFAYTYKGEALRLSQKWDEAVECYKKAAELDPSYVVAPYQAGLCLNSKAIELKDKLADKKTGMLTKENADKIRAVLSESKEFLEKVREADPDRAQVNWAYALYQVYYSLGDEKAKELESIVGGN
jgi:tetratricopeptide (TPR) repeat protein